ncbi:restriction endonuclease subunit S [Snodgrassella alvi]|uniref:restriction endonuclease subunit S n=1 Tax=Snodgrassella alvi TaxID=1196083 RepID=UPI0035186306
MSNRNNIIELLKGVKVELKSLDEIANYEQPTKYLVTSTNYNDEYKTPVLTAGKTFILGYTNDIDGIYTGKNNPVIIFDDFTTANKWVNFDFKVKSSAMKIISSADEEKYHLKYIYYWMNTRPNEKIDNDHKRQWISNYANKKIPVPPFLIQTEIVRILDTFTELTAELTVELTAELTARKKQYDYYRDKLLTFKEDEVEWKALGEVVNYEQPTKYLVKSTSYSDEFKTPVLTAGKTFILGFTDEIDGIYEASETPVIIFDDFTTANKWVDFNFKAKSSAMKMISSTDESKYLLKYIYYWLNTLFEIKANNNHKRQWISNFANKKVPIPPLKEQDRIVKILDKFEALTNSLTEGLPREIALRQRQYEYYRNLLLNFPKVEDK